MGFPVVRALRICQLTFALVGLGLTCYGMLDNSLQAKWREMGLV